MSVTTDAVQLLGYGYVRDCPVERMMRDAKITQTPYRIDGASPIGHAERLCPLVHQGRPASAPPSAPKTAPVQ
jgi:hypothetical protein